MRLIGTMLSALLLFSCQQKSEKGNWTDEDKQKAKDELMAGLNSSPGAEAIAIQLKEEFCDCVVDKIEVHYTNPDEANKDKMGITQYAKPCIYVFDPKRN
jgi:hypothetical protein